MGQYQLYRGEEYGIILKGKLKGFIGDQVVVLEDGWNRGLEK